MKTSIHTRMKEQVARPLPRNFGNFKEMTKSMSSNNWGLFVMLMTVTTVYLPSPADGYCWEPGKNPGFNGPPLVQQVSLSKVRVSWTGLVKSRECADQFLVKYWQRNIPQGYKLSELVPASANHLDIEVLPKIPYTFQAIAREDKGVAGVDWNRSPLVHFQTSSYKEQVQEEPPPYTERTDMGREPESADESAEVQLTDRERQGLLFANVTVELMAVMVVGGFIVVLIVIGILYKILCRKQPANLDESSINEDNDELKLEKESLKEDSNSEHLDA